MQIQNFVFLGISATGCRPTIDRIFEIGLYYWNEAGKFTKWHKLLNPKIEIPSSIQQLAEISDQLIQQAMPFRAIAAELQNILKDKIIVTNNALFKTSFLKAEMKNVGLKLPGRLLCMTKLLQELSAIKPDLMTKMISQPVDSYYALNTAQYLAKAFEHIYELLPIEVLKLTIYKLLKTTNVPLNITSEFLAKIPKTAGVYKFYGEQNSLLYIGKSVCLQERIKSHFAAASLNNKEMRIAQQIKQIDWIETAGELGALLKESQMIKQLMPIYNRKLRLHKGLFTLILEAAPNQYHRLRIEPCQQNDQLELNYGLFRQKAKAEQMLRSLVKNHGFCAKLTGLEKGAGPCFFYQIKKCKGACMNKESMTDYNSRLQKTLAAMLYKTWPYANAIAIRETCDKTNRIEYHIVNHWCYLATVDKETDLYQVNLPKEQISFDLDIYHILTSYFNKYGEDHIIQL